jgi:hypothetical protein
MQFTIATALAVLAAVATAAPATQVRTLPTVTISFSNDQSGRNAAVPIVADGNPNLVGSLFAGSAIDVNGEIIATSAQLTQFVQGTFCVIENFAGTVVAKLNTDATFADLDGNPNAAVPTDVTGLTIICEV